MNVTPASASSNNQVSSLEPAPNRTVDELAAEQFEESMSPPATQQQKTPEESMQEYMQQVANELKDLQDKGLLPKN